MSRKKFLEFEKNIERINYEFGIALRNAREAQERIISCLE